MVMEETKNANRVDGEYATVTWKLVGDHWLDWVAYRIVACTEEDNPLYIRIPNWHATGDETDDLSSAQPYCSGHLKWDGCNEWAFNTRMHYCSPEGILRTVGEVVEIIRTIALQHMPGADPWLLNEPRA